MPFSGQDSNAQIDTSLSGAALLNSSCQGVIEAEVQPVQSDWYAVLDRELGEAERLVIGWRRGGMLYFDTDILAAIGHCGDAFVTKQPTIDGLFASLEQNFTDQGRDELVSLLQALQQPLGEITTMTDTYLAKLREFEQAMLAVQREMTTTVAEVQAAEAEIRSTIDGINAQIAQLSTQIETDRQAIAKARSARSTGIVETIFGVLLAPVTGGISLILAGIGVASIAEAQGEIDGMQNEIAGYQQTISADQDALSDDQRIVATLNGLAMSVAFVLGDITGVVTALDSLRTSWTVLDGELEGTVAKLGKATDASELVVEQAWYDSAVAEWQLVIDHVRQLIGLPVVTNRRQVG